LSLGAIETGWLMQGARYYREQAGRCRRLAAGIRGDPVAERLLAMAEEFDALAARIEGDAATPQPPAQAEGPPAQQQQQPQPEAPQKKE
jgi:hypothetical protein